MDRLRPDDPETIGPYRLIARLGSGGMGVVFLGTKETERVAIKVVRNSFLDDPSLRVRFEREIDTLRKVSSPFVAQMVDSSTEGDFSWHAVEFVNGPTLRELIDSKGPLPDEEWWRLARQLSDALASVHELGIVHRDIKPANIIMSETGPKLIDFGISQDSDATSLTVTGLVAGSPAWLSPEQLEGTPVTAGSDLYSFGSVLVFAATGKSPWGDETSMSVPVVYQKILSGQANLDGLTADQRDLVMSLQHPDPATRAFPPRFASTPPPPPSTRTTVSTTGDSTPDRETSSNATSASSPKEQPATPDSSSPVLAPGPTPGPTPEAKTGAPVAPVPAPKMPTRHRIVFASFVGVVIAAVIAIGVWTAAETVSFRGTVLYTTMAYNLEGSEPSQPGGACFFSFTEDFGDRVPVNVLNSNESRVGQTSLYRGELVNGWTPDGEKTSEYGSAVWDECSFPFEIPVSSREDEFTLEIGDHAAVTLPRADLESGELVIRLTYSGFLLSFETETAEAIPDPYSELLTATLDSLDDSTPWVSDIFFRSTTGDLLVRDGQFHPYKLHTVDPVTLELTPTVVGGWVSAVSPRGDYVAFSVWEDEDPTTSLMLFDLDSGEVVATYEAVCELLYCTATFSPNGDTLYFVQEGDLTADETTGTDGAQDWSVRVIDLDAFVEKEPVFQKQIIGDISATDDALIVSGREKTDGEWEDDTLTVIDLATGAVRSEITTGNPNDAGAYANDFIISEENNLLYFKVSSGFVDDELWAVDLDTLETQYTSPFDTISGFAVSPDGRYLAVSDFSEGEVEIFDTLSQETVQTLGIPSAFAVAFSDSGTLYVGAADVITVLEPSG